MSFQRWSLLRAFVFCFGCFCLFSQSVQAEDPTFPLATARECTPRDGFPNFFEKVKTSGVEIKIAYLGGSITEQPGWRVKSLAHLQKTYPHARFSEINAAIGGTGSELGVYRLKQDVLDAKPDLLFIEFATNDSGAPPQQIQKCMEGIVRQTWKLLPSCDICFVYTLVESQVGPMLEDKLPRAPSAMEGVADHYGIPTIAMAMDVVRLVKEGKLIWARPLPNSPAEKAASGDKVVFASDGVHPYIETGHELYMQAIERSFTPIKEASKGPRPHTLKAPLQAANYEKATIVPIEQANLNSSIKPIDLKTDDTFKYFGARLRSLYHASHPGDSIQFKFKGTSAAIYDVIGPSSSQVIVTLDDTPPRIVSRFDPYCLGYRLSVVPIGSDLSDTVHTVKIEVHPDQPDRIKILGEHAKNLDRPERFQGTNFYPGGILLVGEILK